MKDQIYAILDNSCDESDEGFNYESKLIKCSFKGTEQDYECFNLDLNKVEVPINQDLCVLGDRIAAFVSGNETYVDGYPKRTYMIITNGKLIYINI